MPEQNVLFEKIVLLFVHLFGIKFPGPFIIFVLPLVFPFLWRIYAISPLLSDYALAVSPWHSHGPHCLPEMNGTHITFQTTLAFWLATLPIEQCCWNAHSPHFLALKNPTGGEQRFYTSQQRLNVMRENLWFSPSTAPSFGCLLGMTLRWTAKLGQITTAMSRTKAFSLWNQREWRLRKNLTLKRGQTDPLMFFNWYNYSW